MDEKRVLRIEFDDQSLIDLFKRISSARGETMKDVLTRFIKAYVEENVAIKEAVADSLQD